MQCYKCRKYFKNKQESWTTCKKAIIFFGDLLKISTFRRLLQNPTPKLAASFFSLQKSLTGLILS